MLKEELTKLENLQRICQHEWDKTEIKKIMREELVFIGLADTYYKEVGAGTYENVDCVSRNCKKNEQIC